MGLLYFQVVDVLSPAPPGFRRRANVSKTRYTPRLKKFCMLVFVIFYFVFSYNGYGYNGKIKAIKRR